MIPCRRLADGDALPDEVSVSISQRASPRAYSPAAFVVWAVFGLGLGAIIRSQMTTAVPGSAFDHTPPQWVDAVIMLTYSLVLAGAGAARMVRHDVG